MKNTIIENRMRELNKMQILSFDAEANDIMVRPIIKLKQNTEVEIEKMKKERC